MAESEAEAAVEPDEAAVVEPASTQASPEARGDAGGGVFVVALIGLFALIVALRVAGPSDLYDNDQPKTVSYGVDIAANGAWLAQREPSGAIATKPPMYPWLAAVGLEATGRSDEWVHKLPSLLATVVTAGCVVLLARPYVGLAGACVASAAVLGNPHVFKLMYTARPDMLLAMWCAVGLLAAVRMREGWRAEGGALNRKRWAVAWGGLFWVAVVGGTLAKGPAGFIPVLFLLGLVAYDGAWRRCHLAGQAVGLVAAVAVCGGWFYAAAQAFPELRGTFDSEFTQRVLGNGDTVREYKPWNLLVYFAGRWLPWSVAFLFALPLIRSRKLGWAAGWACVVLAAYMVQSGSRGDYVVPAYAGAAVLVAALFVRANELPGLARDAANLFLYVVAAVGLSCSILVLVAPRPAALEWPVNVFASALAGPDYRKLMYVAAAVAVVGGVSVLLAIHRRAYLAGAVAGAFAIAGACGFFGVTWAKAAQERSGDYVTVLVEQAERLAAQDDRPIVVYEPGYTPVQALLGTNRPHDERALDRLSGRDLVITSLAAWEKVEPGLRGRGELLLQTPPLAESGVDLVLLRVGR